MEYWTTPEVCPLGLRPAARLELLELRLTLRLGIFFTCSLKSNLRCNSPILAWMMTPLANYALCEVIHAPLTRGNLHPLSSLFSNISEAAVLTIARFLEQVGVTP